MRNILLLIVGAFLLIAFLLLVYISRRSVKWFASIRPLRRPKLAILVSLGVWLSIGLLLRQLWGMVNTVIIFLHLGGIWLLCDGIGWGIRRWQSRNRQSEAADTDAQSHESRRKRYYAGPVAILLTVIHLSIGVYLNFNVVQTNYRLATDSGREKLRIALISDVHLGNTFDGEGFVSHLKRIEQQKPDLVVVVGDFVDDDSRRADVETAAAALEKLTTTYGTFFVLGNHDLGYYQGRDFSGKELQTILTDHRIRVMKDDIIPIGRDYQLVGRLDRSFLNRKSMADIATGLDPARYSIVLDHQPQDYENQAAVGVDLVLSGHTHGGQFFPFNQVGAWTGTNDFVYGHERRGNTDFIVSSGMSCWALLFKTGCFSEYVILDIGA